MKDRSVLTHSFVLLMVCSDAFAWSLFAPKDFDECILQNMKGVTSDMAAKIIYGSCREKFPDKSAVETPKRMGEPRISVWDGAKANELIGKVAIGKWQGSMLSITNRNNFELTAIYMGITSQQKCPKSSDAYSQLHICRVAGSNIGPNLTGKVNCQSMPMKTDYCVVGVQGAFEYDLDKFFRGVGLQ